MPGQDLLKEIVAKKKERLLLAKAERPLEILKEGLCGIKTPVKPFLKSINRSGQISLIAEIKKASPSRGVIREDFDLLAIAGIYKECQAAAISVLTEEDYFLGNISYLAQVKEATGLAVLRKDFIFDEYQVYESKLYGADAILLIAGLLSKEQLSQLLELALSLEMDCLVEVHNEKELKKVLSVKKAGLIGINNRCLRTLEVDLKVSERLFPLIPKDKSVVIESGIRKYQDVLFFKVLGAKAVLIGEALIEAPDIRAKIDELMR